LARMRPASSTHSQLLIRLRATIADLADGLQREQAVLGEMIAYVILAMGNARNLQLVTILSLRLTAIEDAAARTLADAMKAVVTDVGEPTPRLIQRATAAIERGGSTLRAKALTRLRKAPERRAALLAPVAKALDELPARVADNAAIAAAMPERSTAHIVAVNR